MLAIVVTQFGGPDVLVASDIPDPVAGAGEVAIDVAIADGLWVETAIRQGDVDDYFDVAPPYVPGAGVAGRVQTVGDGVERRAERAADAAHGLRAGEELRDPPARVDDRCRVEN